MIPTLTGITGLQYAAGLSPAAWFRYGVGLTDDGAGLCSNWADQSGNGRDLKATLTARPTIQADKSVLFDGAANVMKCDAFTFSQPETIYLLMKQVTWTSTDRVFDGNTLNSGIVAQTAGSPGLQAFAGSASTVNNNLAVGSFGVVVTVFNGASSRFQINNTTVVTGDFGASNMGGFTLGSNATPGQWGNFQVKEVILYAAAHDAATRSRVISYLGSVGGLGL